MVAFGHIEGRANHYRRSVGQPGDLEDRLRQRGELWAGRSIKGAHSKVGAETARTIGRPDIRLKAAEILAAILCSNIACIFGIVWMIQGKPKGVKMFLLALICAVVWNVLYFALTEGGGL